MVSLVGSLKTAATMPTVGLLGQLHQLGHTQRHWPALDICYLLVYRVLLHCDPRFLVESTGW